MDTQAIMPTDRSVSDVDSVIELAKLNRSDLIPLTQVVEFAHQILDQGNIKIVEVTNNLADALTRGDILVAKGDSDESVVLCSNDKTFDLKEAETSNSLLLVNDLWYPKKDSASQQSEKTSKAENSQVITTDGSKKLKSTKITGTFNRYFELKECRPRLNKLRSLLSGTLANDQGVQLYSGPHSTEVSSPGIRFDALLGTIQCSEEELKLGLKELQAIVIPSIGNGKSHFPRFEMNSKWVIMDIGYHMKILSLICNYVEECSWRWDSHEIPKLTIIEALKEVEPDFVISQVFDFYFHPATIGLVAQEEHDENPLMNYVADKDSICNFYGNFILATSPKFQLEEFKSMWQKAVPGGDEQDIYNKELGDPIFKTNLNQLNGMALVDYEDSEIKLFPEWKLPTDIQERLQVLFNERERWTLEDISPYIKNLTTPKLNANALLTKYSKVVTGPCGKKMFCAKHGK